MVTMASIAAKARPRRIRQISGGGVDAEEMLAHD